MERDTAKTVIKVIVVFGYIINALIILAGFTVLIGSIIGGSVFAHFVSMPMNQMPFALGSMITVAGLIVGLIMIVLGAVGILVTRALGQYRNWARWLLLVLVTVELIASLCSLPDTLLVVLIDGLLIYFFGFVPTVKNLYERGQTEGGVQAQSRGMGKTAKLQSVNRGAESRKTVTSSHKMKRTKRKATKKTAKKSKKKTKKKTKKKATTRKKAAKKKTASRK